MTTASYDIAPPYAARAVLAALEAYSWDLDPIEVDWTALAKKAGLDSGISALKGLASLSDRGDIRYTNDNGHLAIWRL
jgi:hypothetical protein